MRRKITPRYVAIHMVECNDVVVWHRHGLDSMLGERRVSPCAAAGGYLHSPILEHISRSNAVDTEVGVLAKVGGNSV